MKPLKNSLLLFALMVIIICCNQTSTQEGLITVQDYPPNLWEPEIDLDSHKTGDVEIHRVSIWKEGYLIIFYHDYSGEIQNYHSYRYDTINYNQGFYSWQNDTTVTVKLFNTKTKKEWSVELGIRGGSASTRLID
jgi:hypothetical protein